MSAPRVFAGVLAAAVSLAATLPCPSAGSVPEVASHCEDAVSLENSCPCGCDHPGPAQAQPGARLGAALPSHALAEAAPQSATFLASETPRAPEAPSAAPDPVPV